MAEYGSALVCDGEAVDLLPPDGRAQVEAIREELSGRTKAMLALLDLRANGLASVPGRTITVARWLTLTHDRDD